MPDQEQRYTLDEARRQLALEECRSYGHDWTVLVTDTISQLGIPHGIVCDRCQERRNLESTDRCPDHDGPRCTLHCPTT